MKVVAVSDIHCQAVSIPPCDLLIVAGDLTVNGSKEQVQWFADWLTEQPARYKVYIPGNHDQLFETEPEVAAAVMASAGAIYLKDESVTIEGVVIYGSSWVLLRGKSSWAFSKPKNSKEWPKIWKKIPHGVDILVTHQPPHGILDRVPKKGHQGDVELTKRVLKVKPQYHLFGHIHEGYGQKDLNGIRFRNVAVCNVKTKPVNAPTAFELEPRS